MKKLLLMFLLMSSGCNNLMPDSEDRNRFYESILMDGRSRTFLFNLPPGYYEHTTRLPLVIALHGTGGDAAQFERSYHFTEKANTSGFIVAYPEGTPNRGVLRLRMWNAGTCCGDAAERQEEDVRFISTLISELIAKYRVDSQRVYITGMSNGGMMTYRLACQVPDQIAAVAVVSGTMVIPEPCSPGRPVPVLHIHSMHDTIVPYEGGEGLGGYLFPPVDSVLTAWSSINNCASTPVVEANARYTLTRWTSCRGGSAVESYLTNDGGHSWPGGDKPRRQADPPSTAIDANEVIWAFFKRFSKM